MDAHLIEWLNDSAIEVGANPIVDDQRLKYLKKATSQHPLFCSKHEPIATIMQVDASIDYATATGCGFLSLHNQLESSVNVLGNTENAEAGLSLYKFLLISEHSGSPDMLQQIATAIVNEMFTSACSSVITNHCILQPNDRPSGEIIYVCGKADPIRHVATQLFNPCTNFKHTQTTPSTTSSTRSGDRKKQKQQQQQQQQQQSPFNDDYSIIFEWGLYIPPSMTSANDGASCRFAVHALSERINDTTFMFTLAIDGGSILSTILLRNEVHDLRYRDSTEHSTLNEFSPLFESVERYSSLARDAQAHTLMSAMTRNFEESCRKGVEKVRSARSTIHPEYKFSWTMKIPRSQTMLLPGGRSLYFCESFVGNPYNCLMPFNRLMGKGVVKEYSSGGQIGSPSVFDLLATAVKHLKEYVQSQLQQRPFSSQFSGSRIIVTDNGNQFQDHLPPTTPLYRQQIPMIINPEPIIPATVNMLSTGTNGIRLGDPRTSRLKSLTQSMSSDSNGIGSGSGSGSGIGSPSMFSSPSSSLANFSRGITPSSNRISFQHHSYQQQNLHHRAAITTKQTPSLPFDPRFGASFAFLNQTTSIQKSWGGLCVTDPYTRNVDIYVSQLFIPQLLSTDCVKDTYWGSLQVSSIHEYSLQTNQELEIYRRLHGSVEVIKNLGMPMLPNINIENTSGTFPRYYVGVLTPHQQSDKDAKSKRDEDTNFKTTTTTTGRSSVMAVRDAMLIKKYNQKQKMEMSKNKVFLDYAGDGDLGEYEETDCFDDGQHEDDDDDEDGGKVHSIDEDTENPYNLLLYSVHPMLESWKPSLNPVELEALIKFKGDSLSYDTLQQLLPVIKYVSTTGLIQKFLSGSKIQNSILKCDTDRSHIDAFSTAKDLMLEATTTEMQMYMSAMEESSYAQQQQQQQKTNIPSYTVSGPGTSPLINTGEGYRISKCYNLVYIAGYEDITVMGGTQNKLCSWLRAILHSMNDNRCDQLLNADSKEREKFLFSCIRYMLDTPNVSSSSFKTNHFTTETTSNFVARFLQQTNPESKEALETHYTTGEPIPDFVWSYIGDERIRTACIMPEHINAKSMFATLSSWEMAANL
jgi:hypothetical protein